MVYTKKKKQTRREKFLAKMEKIVPWKELKAVIEPYYPKAGKKCFVSSEGLPYEHSIIGYLEKPQRDGGLGEGNRNACIVSR